MRGRLWLLLGAVVAAAGCLRDDVLPDPGLSLDAPIVIAGGATGETFLAVGADGTILACTHGGFTGASPTWVSRDLGDTWAALDTGDPVPSGDCDVAISPGGAWAVLYDYVGGATTAVSRDEGATWTVNHHGAPPVTGAVDRPWFDFVGERIVMTYKSVQYHPTVVAATYSDDDGDSWSIPAILDVAADPDFPAAIQSDVHVMDDGTAWVFLTSYQTNPLAGSTGFQVEQRYDVVWTDDGGTTWSRAPVHQGPGEVINGAGVGGDRFLWWAYAGPGADGPGESVWVLWSDDRGQTWQGPEAVASGADFDTPAIAGRADGTATLLALDRGAGTLDMLRLDASDPGLVRATARVMEDNGIGQSAEFMDVTHGPDGRAYATYAWNVDARDCATDPARPLNASCLHLARETADR